MRTISLVVTIIFAGSALCAEPDPASVQKLFKSENFTVTWGKAPSYDAAAELEIGDGDGHGQTLEWLRFKPEGDRVDVLSARLKYSRVEIKKTQIKAEAYTALLQKLAVVDSAKPKLVERRFPSSSSADFWVHARLTANKKALIDLEWAGYDGSNEEMRFIKPKVAAELAHTAVEDIEFKEHSLTKEESAWVSAKFTRDWKNFKAKDKERDPHWWVKERYLLIIGMVGDAAVLPQLRDIIRDDPKDRRMACAIAAAYRILKKEEKQIDEKEIEKERLKILELLRDVK